MPKTRKKLKRKVFEKSENQIVVWFGQDNFEDTQGFTLEKFEVDYHTFTYYFWQLNKLLLQLLINQNNMKIMHIYTIRGYETCYNQQIPTTG